MSKYDTEDRVFTAIFGYLFLSAGMVTAGVVAIETGIATEQWVETVLQLGLGIPFSIGLTAIGLCIMKKAIEGEP